MRVYYQWPLRNSNQVLKAYIFETLNASYSKANNLKVLAPSVAKAKIKYSGRFFELEKWKYFMVKCFY